jgi:hypothetical protein
VGGIVEHLLADVGLDEGEGETAGRLGITHGTGLEHQQHR